MEKIKIKSYKSSWSNSAGVPYISAKSQRPYAMVMIETAEKTSLGGNKISGFANAGDPHLNWNVGEEHTVFLEKSKDDKYTNFRVPKESSTGFDARNAQLEAIESKLDEILDILSTKKGTEIDVNQF